MYDAMKSRMNIESSRRKMNAEEIDSSKRQMQRFEKQKVDYAEKARCASSPSDA